MKYESMTVRELIHYLDLYSTDPVVRLLLDKINNEDLVSQLVDVGMDPVTNTFDDDHMTFYPGEYIEHLRKGRDYSSVEYDNLKWQFEDLQESYDELKARSIMDFIEEVRQEQRANADLVKEAMGTVHAYKKENERLKEQIDMWAKMNQAERAPE